MKLLFCPICSDVLALRVKEHRTCHCGKSYGRYTDELNAVVGGDGILIGFANSTFIAAIHDHIDRPEGRYGHEFTAFIIPESAPSVKREGVNTWIPMMQKMMDKTG